MDYASLYSNYSRMPIADIINRASSLIGRKITKPLDEKLFEEIVLFNENVCVHPGTTSCHYPDHNFGCLIIRKVKDKGIHKTLILSWTPIQEMEKQYISYLKDINKSHDGKSLKKAFHMNQFSFNDIQAIDNDEQISTDKLFNGLNTFSVDLGNMRSLKVMFENESLGIGQFIILSREGHYKIFHMHFGGLDKVLKVLSDWPHLHNIIKNNKNKNTQQQSRNNLILETDKTNYLSHFSVVRAFPLRVRLHPEEGTCESLSRNLWKKQLDMDGRVNDELSLKRAVFFGGINPNIRSEVWPILLGCYSYQSTQMERTKLKAMKKTMYEGIKASKAQLSKEDFNRLLEEHSTVIFRDVPRTDRNHPYYMGNHNPTLEVLAEILENFALAHPHIGYIQGMSDLLAPILAEIKDESEAYWCFEGLMKHTIFNSTSKLVNLDKQLTQLKELLKVLLPEFYRHFVSTEEGMLLAFCHRWLIVCFKREFQDEAYLKIWEACWASPETPHFPIFICAAILSLYGGDIISQKFYPDEVLMHFNSLSMNMDVNIVLKKARCILYDFKRLDFIPCTLSSLCHPPVDGMWDARAMRTMVCNGHRKGENCPVFQF